MFILSQAWSTDTVLPSWLVNKTELETGEIKFTERPFHSFISLQRIQDSRGRVLAMEIDPACPGAGGRFHNKNSCALERSICSLSSKWNICITSLQLDVMATVFTKKQQKCKREQGDQLLWEHEGSQTQIHLVEITPRSFPWHISGAASQAERASPHLVANAQRSMAPNDAASCFACFLSTLCHCFRSPWIWSTTAIQN